MPCIRLLVINVSMRFQGKKQHNNTQKNSMKNRPALDLIWTHNFAFKAERSTSRATRRYYTLHHAHFVIYRCQYHKHFPLWTSLQVGSYCVWPSTDGQLWPHAGRPVLRRDQSLPLWSTPSLTSWTVTPTMSSYWDRIVYILVMLTDLKLQLMNLNCYSHPLNLVCMFCILVHPLDH